VDSWKKFGKLGKVCALALIKSTLLLDSFTSYCRHITASTWAAYCPIHEPNRQVTFL